ncbi:mannan-binding protein [Kamptonema formosum]|uniref:mannan-binding protein n=1 Tax=Kamptonema formosum TaxID=331992 RepID=UPI00036524B0
MKGVLKNKVRENYACGCNLDAGPIWSQQDANSKCPKVCANNGGWSGQWVKVEAGQKSVCGCNTCSISASPVS